jgi:hypothetical protein
MGLALPTEDGSAGTWDTILNAALGATGDGIDGHDHTTGKGVKIPSGALNINADVSWASGGSNFSLTDVKALDFAEVAAADVVALSSAIFVSSADHNLYFRNSLGVNVKIIDGSTLNVSITGGIGGDYASISALVDYDDASDSYRFRQQISTLVRQFAKLQSADVALYEYKAAGTTPVPANAVTLKSPTALAAPYSITMPAAVPAVAHLVAMSSAGALSVTGDMQMAANESLTLSGTGSYKHGTKTISTALFNNLCSTAAGGLGASGGLPGIVLNNNTTTYHPLPVLPPGARLKGITVWFPDTTSRSDTTCVLYQTSSADPALRAFATTGVTIGSNSGTAKKIAATSLTPTNSQTYWVQFSNSATTPAISAISVDYDVVA